MRKINAGIQNLLDKPYADKVTLDQVAHPAEETEWYLPHHNVVHPSKPNKYRFRLFC